MGGGVVVMTNELMGHIVELTALALVGFLLRRAIGNLDDSIKDLKADLHTLDLTDRAQGKDILEQGIRLRLLETGHARLSDRFDEFGKFLQAMGFKRRDRPDE